MKKITYKDLLLVTGILIAIIVILMMNSSILSEQQAVINYEATPMDFSQLSIPNLIVQLLNF